MFSLYKLIRCQHFKKIYRLQCTSFCILWGIFKKQTSSKAFQHKFHKGYQHCSMCSCNFDCNQRQITNILLTTLRVINDRQYYSHNANVYHCNPFLLLIACTSYAFFATLQPTQVSLQYWSLAKPNPLWCIWCSTWFNRLLCGVRELLWKALIFPPVSEMHNWGQNLCRLCPNF